jgi:hypothetical protein
MLAAGPTPLSSAPPDGIDLTVGKGPGASELTLTWTGGTPIFEVFRSGDATNLIDPLNLDGQTSANSFVATQGSPELEFFRIAAPPLFDVTGTWTTTLDFGGTLRPIALQLHQRSRGRILGRVLGGTASRTVLDGLMYGNRLTLRLQFREPGNTRVFILEGTAGGGSFPATADDGTTAQAITMTHRADVLFERGLGIFEGDSLQFVAVVEDGLGAFVSGGFVGLEECGLWACSGGVTSFVETGPNITMGLETDGGCSAGSSVSLVFDPASQFHSGTYTFNSCAGTTSGSIVGVNGSRTRSDHVAEILATLAGIADNLESGTPFASPHPSFATDYLHYGRSLTDIFAGLNAEMTTYEKIRADFRPRWIHTVDDPDIWLFLTTPATANFEELRLGIPTGGGPVETYVDTAHESALDLLSVIDRTTGNWIIRGNRMAALDQPFAYTMGADRLTAPTPFGQPAYVSIGPYGSHFPPNTGHIDGNSKADYFGFLAQDDSELDELVGDGDGVREPGEIWGYWGGVAGERVRDRRVVYIAPADATLFELTYTSPNGVYFDNEPDWVLNMKLPSGHRYRLGHVGKIAGELRDAVFAATAGAIDTNTFSGPDGEVLAGVRVPVTAGLELARPQLQAEPVEDFPDHYYSRGGFVPVPHAQMEFFIGGLTGGGDIADPCFYAFMDPSIHDAHQLMMDSDMANPIAYAYEWQQWRAWQFKAEAKLCAAFSGFPSDFSDLYTDLGGWFERDDDGVAPDELLAYVPIRKDVASYDASLYDSPSVNALIHRKRAFDLPFTWLLPDLTPTMPCWPSGEVLSRTATDLLIKWRNSGCMEGDNLVVYQRAAYRLDDSGLTVKWGPLAVEPGTAGVNPLGTAEPCDGVAVVCYDHIAIPGF